MYTRIIFFTILILGNWPDLTGQNVLTLDEAIKIATANNLDVELFRKSVEQETAMIDGQIPIDKTEVFYQYDKNNIAENGRAIHVFGIGQNFKMPGYFKAYEQAQRAQVAVQENILEFQLFSLERSLIQLYEDYTYASNKAQYYLRLDSIYRDYLVQAERNLELGGGTIMEILTARQKQEALQLELKQINNDLTSLEGGLSMMLQVDEAYVPEISEYNQKKRKDIKINEHPIVKIRENQVEKARVLTNAHYNDRLPEINLSLFGGFNSFQDVVIYPGIEVGLSVSLSNKYYNARKKADQIQIQQFETNLQAINQKLEYNRLNLERRLVNLESSLESYNRLEETSDQLISSAKRALDGGEIDYFQYLTTLDEGLQTKIQLIEIIHDYNNTIIQYNYLLNQQ
jgi:cobalt-zinc-cadmium resistance protein CzcA